MAVGAADLKRDTMLKAVVDSCRPGGSLDNDKIGFIVPILHKSKRWFNLWKSKKPPEVTRDLEEILSKDVTTLGHDEKLKVIKGWIQALIPRTNFFWITSYPRQYLQCILTLIDPEFVTRVSSKETLDSLLDTWCAERLSQASRKRNLPLVDITAGDKNRPVRKKAKQASPPPPPPP
eukprot:Sspe_Gene.98389::Locus_71813_Transcript_1_1_Confidence_1.000_Length_569::g.98389::m.98389